MEWDKLWAYNKDFIDTFSPRYTAIVKETASIIEIENGPEGIVAETHPLHQKNPVLGSKSVFFGKTLYIETGDAKDLTVGEKITLMKWGNAEVTSIQEKEGTIWVKATLKLDDKDFKGTKKLTWITKDDATNFEVTLVELDHLITKKKVEENESVKDIVNYNSYISYTAIAEGPMKMLKKGDFI